MTVDGRCCERWIEAHDERRRIDKATTGARSARDVSVVSSLVDVAIEEGPLGAGQSEKYIIKRLLLLEAAGPKPRLMVLCRGKGCEDPVLGTVRRLLGAGRTCQCHS